MHQNVACPRIKFQNFLGRVQPLPRPHPVGEGDTSSLPHNQPPLRLWRLDFDAVPLHCLLVPLQLAVAGDTAGRRTSALVRVGKGGSGHYPGLAAG